MWQWWAIFAPDPIRNTMVMDAEIVDAKGMRHIFEFPRLADLPWWQKVPRYRQPKFTANMVVDEYAPQRKFTAKYAVRQLDMKPEALPAGRESLLSRHRFAHAGLHCRDRSHGPTADPHD